MHYIAIVAWVITIAAALGNTHRPGFLLFVALAAFAMFVGVVYAKRNKRND